ncbi:MAG: hypothetical protein LBV63_04190 [Candidatus Methanoplasma sp.]|nr:hypothetical protein [Candidatus Methanoplasma sp.]
MVARTRTVLLRFPVDLPDYLEIYTNNESAMLKIDLKTVDIVTYRGTITVSGVSYDPELSITGTRAGLLAKLSVYSGGRELIIEVIPGDAKEWGKGISRVLDSIIGSDL